MNIKLAFDLADVDVNDLDDDQLRDAFVANFKRAEAVNARARTYTDACAQIIERLEKGELLGLCRDCGAPIFEHDKYIYRPADVSFTCAARACVSNRTAKSAT